MQNSRKKKFNKGIIVVCVVLILTFVSCTVGIFTGRTPVSIYAEETENLALGANVSVSDSMSDAVSNLWQINDGDYTTETIRLTDDSVQTGYVGDDYFQFNWEEPVKVNTVLLSSWYCDGQAPVSWKIGVYKESTKSWHEIGFIENLKWNDNSEVQSKEIIFETQENIKSLRVYITDNNNSWHKYVIKEIEIYNDEDTVYADFNDDSEVDLRDFVRAKKYINHSGHINEQSADMDRNNKVDVSDVSALKEYLVGKNSPVPFKEGYVLDWSDEFDGTVLDDNKWLSMYFPHATSNDKLAAAKYTIKDGILSLILDETTKGFSYGNDSGLKVSSIQTYEKNYLHPMAKQYNSDRNVNIYDGYTTKYGYFEMKCKAPSCGGGGAYAWWMTGIEDDETIEILADGSEKQITAHNGEIDIIENLFSRPDYMRFNVIPWNDENLTYDGTCREELEGDFVNEWHTYVFDWTPDTMDFYVDGKLIKHVDEAPQYEMCMYLSMYMRTDSESGDYYNWGYANDVFPKKWDIDYIRVYKKAE